MADKPVDPEYQSAKELQEQGEYLLNDEIKYAEILRLNRRNAIALLAILVGVGMLRLDLHRQPGEISAVNNTAMVWILWFLTGSMILYAISVFFLFTERSLFSLVSGANTIGHRQRALAALDYDRAFNRQLEGASPTLVAQVRRRSIRQAYLDLRARNVRVRRRLLTGWICMFLGLCCVFGAFTVYMWNINVPESRIEMLVGSSGAEYHDQPQP